jgi:hypothetical protein
MERNWTKVCNHFRGAIRCWWAALFEEDRKTRNVLFRFGMTLAGRAIALAIGNREPARPLVGPRLQAVRMG